MLTRVDDPLPLTVRPAVTQGCMLAERGQRQCSGAHLGWKGEGCTVPSDCRGGPLHDIVVGMMQVVFTVSFVCFGPVLWETHGHTGKQRHFVPVNSAENVPKQSVFCRKIYQNRVFFCRK